MYDQDEVRLTYVSARSMAAVRYLRDSFTIKGTSLRSQLDYLLFEFDAGQTVAAEDTPPLHEPWDGVRRRATDEQMLLGEAA